MPLKVARYYSDDEVLPIDQEARDDVSVGATSAPETLYGDRDDDFEEVKLHDHDTFKNHVKKLVNMQVFMEVHSKRRRIRGKSLNFLKDKPTEEQQEFIQQALSSFPLMTITATGLKKITASLYQEPNGCGSVNKSAVLDTVTSVLHDLKRDMARSFLLEHLTPLRKQVENANKKADSVSSKFNEMRTAYLTEIEMLRNSARSKKQSFVTNSTTATSSSIDEDAEKKAKAEEQQEIDEMRYYFEPTQVLSDVEQEVLVKVLRAKLRMIFDGQSADRAGGGAVNSEQLDKFLQQCKNSEMQRMEAALEAKTNELEDLRKELDYLKYERRDIISDFCVIGGGENKILGSKVNNYLEDLVEKLRQDVADEQRKTIDAKKAATRLEGEVQDLQATIDELRPQISMLEKELSDNRGDLLVLKGRLSEQIKYQEQQRAEWQEEKEKDRLNAKKAAEEVANILVGGAEQPTNAALRSKTKDQLIVLLKHLEQERCKGLERIAQLESQLRSLTGWSDDTTDTSCVTCRACGGSCRWVDTCYKCEDCSASWTKDDVKESLDALQRERGSILSAASTAEDFGTPPRSISGGPALGASAVQAGPRSSSSAPPTTATSTRPTAPPLPSAAKPSVVARRVRPGTFSAASTVEGHCKSSNASEASMSMYGMQTPPECDSQVVTPTAIASTLPLPPLQTSPTPEAQEFGFGPRLSSPSLGPSKGMEVTPSMSARGGKPGPARQKEPIPPSKRSSIAILQTLRNEGEDIGSDDEECSMVPIQSCPARSSNLPFISNGPLGFVDMSGSALHKQTLKVDILEQDSPTKLKSRKPGLPFGSFRKSTPQQPHPQQQRVDSQDTDGFLQCRGMNPEDDSMVASRSQRRASSASTSPTKRSLRRGPDEGFGPLPMSSVPSGDSDMEDTTSLAQRGSMTARSSMPASSGKAKVVSLSLGVFKR